MFRGIATLLLLSFSSLADNKKIHSFLNKYCYECHDEDVQKGSLRLDNFFEISDDAQFDILSKIEEVVYLGDMPPKKKKQPSANESKDILNEIKKSFISKQKVSPFKKKLKHPSYANYLKHDTLFAGTKKEKAYTPARRWLISGEIYLAKFKSYLGEDSKRIGGLMFHNFSNPFLSENKNSIRYYADGVLNGKHISIIKGNVGWLTRYVLTEALLKAGVDVPMPPKKIVKSHMDTPTEFRNLILAEGEITDKLIDDALTLQFNRVLNRKPTSAELKNYRGLFRDLAKLSDKYFALEQTLNTVWLEEEIYYRFEFGSGKEDEFGRKLVMGKEAADSIAYALTDSIPDAALSKAVLDNSLKSREDYKREVLRLINSPDFPHSTPRVVRFFREFFGYDKARDIFKDLKRFGDYRKVPGQLIKEADLLVAHWLKEDKDVFKNLLGSDKFYVHHNGNNAAAKANNEKMLANYKKMLKNAEGINWRENALKEIPGSKLLKTNYKPVPDRNLDKKKHDAAKKNNNRMKGKVGSIVKQLTLAEMTIDRNFNPVPEFNMGWKRPHQLLSWNIDVMNWDYPPIQPTPIKNRKGILTHPAWLIAHSQNQATDPVKRGHWILENLLAGNVPDVPIGVEANIPGHPEKTLRTRLAEVTEKESCWRCHQYMNPLGLPFESFDDFGRFRTEEQLEYPENKLTEGTGKPIVPATYKTLPVETHGALMGTGNPELDGEVKDVFELVERLSKSARVRQSIIRHTFRFFMGRNEALSDSQTLIDADKAYLESGGSFKALIVSLLTSDSFIYRK